MFARWTHLIKQKDDRGYAIFLGLLALVLVAATNVDPLIEIVSR